MTGFSTVRQSRLADGVVRQLIEAAARGDLQPGQPLPTESELVDQFGVSRTVIRDALNSLAQKGVILVQQGRRTVLLNRDNWDILDPGVIAIELAGDENQRLLEEMIRVRLALECDMAEQAARVITPAALAEIETLLARMRDRVDSPDLYLDDDVTFHELVMTAAGNRVARAILRSLHEPLRLTRQITNRVPGSLPRAQTYHETIFAALRAHDPPAAREAMRSHLTWTLDAWLASREPLAASR